MNNDENIQIDTQNEEVIPSSKNKSKINKKVIGIVAACVIGLSGVAFGLSQLPAVKILYSPLAVLAKSLDKSVGEMQEREGKQHITMKLDMTTPSQYGTQPENASMLFVFDGLVGKNSLEGDVSVDFPVDGKSSKIDTKMYYKDNFLYFKVPNTDKYIKSSPEDFEKLGTELNNPEDMEKQMDNLKKMSKILLLSMKETPAALKSTGSREAIDFFGKTKKVSKVNILINKELIKALGNDIIKNVFTNKEFQDIIISSINENDEKKELQASIAQLNDPTQQSQLLSIVESAVGLLDFKSSSIDFYVADDYSMSGVNCNLDISMPIAGNLSGKLNFESLFEKKAVNIEIPNYLYFSYLIL